jgi:SAM-dependent methyltransferase
LDKLADLREFIDYFERNRSFYKLARFRERAEALDWLDAYHLDSQRSRFGPTEEKGALYRQAISLRTELEAVNLQLFDRIRKAIRRGDGRDALFGLAYGAIAASQKEKPATDQGDSYDYLDELVSGVLRLAPSDATVALSDEMVAYQPTPARHVFDLIRRTRLTVDDVFIDLGSGLGHVPLLIAICTEAHAIGIDLEPSFVECARVAAEGLELTRATFRAQDARDVDLMSGTVFYLYTPFRGAILRTMLDRLRVAADVREIRVCTFGPCTPIIAAEPWLTVDAVDSGHISVFRSRPSPP